MDYHGFPEKLVKTRKKHQCWGCCSIIEPGTLVLKSSGVHVGEGYWNGWFCPKCASFIKTKSSFDWHDLDEGLYIGDLTNYDDYETHTVTPLTELKLITNTYQNDLQNN